MKTASWLFVALTLVCAAAPSGVASAQPPPAAADQALRQILDHVDDLYRGASSHTKLTMRVSTAQATRDLSLEQWSKGRDRFLVRILAPAKERGTSTLKAGENIWNYLPKIDRVIKISPSMMGGSWMGSHFTNGDLVKQSRLANDYTYTKTFEGARGGESVIEVTLLPKQDAAVVWGKIVVTVRAADRMPLTMMYFDESKKLAQTMTFSDVKKLGDRQVPSVVRIVPAAKPGEFTELRYEVLEIDLTLPESLFSLQNLQK